MPITPLVLVASFMLMFSSATLADAQTRPAVLSWTHDGLNVDGFVIQRKNSHCLVSGTFTDLQTVGPAVRTFTDNASPFPYACYHVRATNAGVSDSGNSNDDGTILPPHGGQSGLRRR